MLIKTTKNSIILATTIAILAVVIGISLVLGAVKNSDLLAATSYTITYDTNGGVLQSGVSNPQSVTAGQTITLPNVEKVGYSASWIDQTTPSGTAISNRAGLAGISGSGSYYLTGDIDLSGSNWTPISSFSGTLDGRGHAIKNMTMSGSGVQYRGLFAQLSGTVKNLKMENVNINVSYSGHFYVGGIAGSGSGTINIINCYTSGSITTSMSGSGMRLGGVIGEGGGGVISQCTNNCSLSSSGEAYAYVGGIGGELRSGAYQITNCVNLATLSSNSTAASSSNTTPVAGIVGYNSPSHNITNCYNLAKITSTSRGTSLAGGIVGYGSSSSSKITNCFNTGNLSGNTTGQIYTRDAATLSNCYYLTGTSGTAQGTAIGDKATLAQTFYNNMSAADQGNWNYTAGEYPTPHFYDLCLTGNIGDKKCIGASTTVKASYTANTYNVIYNGNGATSGTMANSSIVYDSGTKVRVNAYVLTGYTFVGWSPNANAREPAIGDQGVFAGFSVGANNNGASFTLYAIWKSTINLDQQGGSGGSTSVTNTRNLSLNAATRPNFTNFTFGGYWTQIGGKGTQYYDANMASKHIFDLAAGSTLYAKWTSTINLDQQGGVNGDTSVSGVYNLDMPSASAPTRNGYTFGGYFTGKGGSGTQYYSMEMASARKYDLPSGTTLYAKWTCTVILDQQGGADGTASVEPVYNKAMPTATAPVRTGWTFGGYYTAVGGAGKQYYTKDMTSANDWTEATNVTLYAKWTCTVALNMEGGAGGTSSITVTYNAPMPPATAPTRMGYTFGGYYTESNGNGTRFYSEKMVSVQNWNLAVNTALYAKWVANVYTVTFEYNGATEGNEIASKNVSFGSFYSDLPQPSKAGSSFAGWFLENTYQNAVTSTTVVNTADNHKIYAKWSTWLQIYASGAATTVGCISEINALYTEGAALIIPGNGLYVSAISFDNSLWFGIEYYDFTINDVDFGIFAQYHASTKTNRLGIDLKYIDSTYFDRVGPIKLYLTLSSTKYTSLKAQSSGTAEKTVLVTSTLGGCVTIIGDDFENLGDSDTITIKADVCINGYEFLGWYDMNNTITPISTEQSVKFRKDLVYERVIVAKFAPVSGSDNINGDTGNV